MGSDVKIQWIVDGVFGSEAQGYTSPLASNRYRVLGPCDGLRRQGVSVQLIAPEQWNVMAQTVGQADVVVIAKLAPGDEAQRLARLMERVLNQMRHAQAEGIKVIADFCDDHFDRSDVGAYWRALAREADVRVAGTEAMAQALAAYSQQPVHVIGDPVLGTKLAPRVFLPSRRASGLWPWGRSAMPSRLRLLWYGNLNNWPALVPWIQALVPLAQQQPWILRVVTTPHPEIERYADEFNRRHGSEALVEFVEWSLDTQRDLLAESHVVLLPSDTTSQKKQVKTANRLTDALQAGNYVVASALPAYQTFVEGVALSDRPMAALGDYLKNPKACLERIALGQRLVEASAAPEVIALQWLRACEAAIALDQRALASADPPAARASLVKLNLGCGDKILEGYVNVDVVAARSGKAPDVQCDLRQLKPFEDGIADEVLAVHVVEHFWRWEVEDILREWVRVLKPGGRMVLECPNLQSACEAFLADPEVASREDAAGQRSMWVFYGDPQWRDPLMVHRWGYTPRSLGRLLESIGLIDVRQEPALYKLREPRDMRVVGRKP